MSEEIGTGAVLTQYECPLYGCVDAVLSIQAMDGQRLFCGLRFGDLLKREGVHLVKEVKRPIGGSHG